MLSKSFIATAFLLALTSSVNADSDSGCVITPALGLTGTAGAGNVQQPTSSAPCGSIPIAQNIDSSTPIAADANGEFKPQITSFAGGADGSRLISSVKVDAGAKGNNFVDAQMVTNGDQAPGSAGSQQLAVKLPEGIQCTGGSNKNRCLVSFTTSTGVGNCVVVTQDSATTTSTQATGGGKTPTTGQTGDETKSNNGSTKSQNGGETTPSQKAQAGTPNQKKRMIRKRML